MVTKMAINKTGTIKPRPHLNVMFHNVGVSLGQITSKKANSYKQQSIVDFPHGILQLSYVTQRYLYMYQIRTLWQHWSGSFKGRDTTFKNILLKSEGFQNIS